MHLEESQAASAEKKSGGGANLVRWRNVEGRRELSWGTRERGGDAAVAETEVPSETVKATKAGMQAMVA
jgi:hypothetical protein